MIVIGVAFFWAGYTAGLFGWCLVRGYCITLADILNWKFPQEIAGPPESGQAQPGGGGAPGTRAVTTAAVTPAQGSPAPQPGTAAQTGNQAGTIVAAPGYTTPSGAVAQAPAQALIPGIQAT